ncbi:MAG: hypothetical protein KW806_00850 [Candidatus Yanofskybacteria bacterium]|nr:hypothetical protein [Candidatus Yanofskybacteria bacterium]
MTYIILLGLLVSGVIAGLFDHNPVSNLVTKLKSSITEVSFPKSQHEILVEKAQGSYQALETFFGTTANDLVKSKSVPEKEKQAIREAFQAFQQSQDILSQLKETEEEPGVIEAAIKKVLKLDQPTATSIPSQCKMVCPPQ